ncbi:peptidoglycan endopeptidase [Xanthomonas campestris pv. plantaginis]|uniref:peptidoglycan endopeptidase n=1 Tax=Xanthomonas campestris TaxID=339 RepID=UPI002B23723F|nr:peptidoglycan endopeptidase [Xanthomonas campestris]MEA9605698.1 peptidoglycan endopeptidase [Xanthomonas campestris pv. plantaginis]
MRTADVERFLNIPYDADTNDCADLVVQVQHKLFGREVQMPARRPRGAAGQVALGELSQAYAVATTTPVDGDLVLMFDKGQSRPGHVGVFFYLAHEGWVLHTTSALGSSWLHRVRELPDYGARIEGYYTWV